MEISEESFKKIIAVIGQLQGQTIANNYIVMEIAAEVASSKQDKHAFVSGMFERVTARHEEAIAIDALAHPVAQETTWALEAFFSALGDRLI